MTNHITYEVKVLIEDDLISGLSQREVALKIKVSKTLVCNINKKLKMEHHWEGNLVQDDLKYCLMN
ncbi:hypothetical protein A0H76_812 [Hepatospora eriocheir]|uniref:HTH psq-type domain-containing protein n=1 Tax=Hepatospora eriocheir TaxID=1081669 RepID=A0A1X0Q6Q0_9MICR|nr:hypothetical protein A0H76_812 [Hepatospora eriocheir]